MDFKSLLANFSKLHGLGDVSLEDGGCSLQVGNDLQIQIETDEEEKNIFISSPVCHIPQDSRRLQLLDALMMVHGYGVATNNSYFTLNPNSNEIILFTRMPMEWATDDNFNSMIDNFAQTLICWKDNIKDGKIYEHVQQAPSSNNMGEATIRV
jgi:hypothetical protein